MRKHGSGHIHKQEGFICRSQFKASLQACRNLRRLRQAEDSRSASAPCFCAHWHSGRCLVENDDPTAFGAGAIQFEVRENVEKFDSSKDKFENYQDIEDRVIGGITFKGRTYKRIGYDWIQYIAQLDDNRALSIGLRNMDCVPGTMPDIILNNMTFQ